MVDTIDVANVLIPSISDYYDRISVLLSNFPRPIIANALSDRPFAVSYHVSYQLFNLLAKTSPTINLRVSYD